MPNSRTQGQKVAHSDALIPEINAPGMVQLYNAQRTILVPEGNLDSFIADGWTRDYIDPVVATGELKTLADALVTAFQDLVDEAEAKGELDPDNAIAVAQAAFVELGATASNVLQSIQLYYPVKQGRAVRMTRPAEDQGDDDEIHVDPGQVELHEADGWATAKGGK